MKVLGKRILLDKPQIEESVIQLSPELQEEFERKQIAKWKRLTVYAVGEDVTSIKEGDLVYVSPMYLQTAEIINAEGEEDKIMVREADIALVW